MLGKSSSITSGLDSLLWNCIDDSITWGSVEVGMRDWKSLMRVEYIEHSPSCER